MVVVVVMVTVLTVGGYIDLRSTTSHTADFTGAERQCRTLLSAGGQQTSSTSPSVGRNRSRLKMPTGHHQQSGLLSRLHIYTQTEVRLSLIHI